MQNAPNVAPVQIYDAVAFDSVLNVLTGLGTQRDRATSTTHVKGQIWFPEELEAAYQSAICRKVIDIPIDDMLRHPRKFDDQEISLKKIEKFEKRWKKLQVPKHVSEVLKWGSVYGGGAIIPVYRGVTDAMMAEPFDVEDIRAGALMSFVTVDPRNLNPTGRIEQNPLRKDYLKPSHYTLNGSTAQIHSSWLIKSEGLPLPRQDRQRNNYWGQSRLRVLLDDINKALMVRGSMSQLLDETNLDIFSIEGLTAAIAGGGEDGIRARVAVLSELKSTFKVVLKDTTEKFERAQIGVSGFADVLGLFYGIVAAMAEIPVSRFMGTAAKGLNATGEGDMRNYYDGLASRQITDIVPIYDQLDAIIMHDLGWDYTEQWDYTFPSLWQEDPGAKADRELKRAQMDQIYITAGVVNEAIVAKELRQEGTYCNITEKDIEKLEKLSEEFDDAEHEASVATFKNTAADPDGSKAAAKAAKAKGDQSGLNTNRTAKPKATVKSKTGGALK